MADDQHSDGLGDDFSPISDSLVAGPSPRPASVASKQGGFECLCCFSRRLVGLLRDRPSGSEPKRRKNRENKKWLTDELHGETLHALPSELRLCLVWSFGDAGRIASVLGEQDLRVNFDAFSSGPVVTITD